VQLAQTHNILGSLLDIVSISKGEGRRVGKASRRISRW
jgi:hypothetical protein